MASIRRWGVVWGGAAAGALLVAGGFALGTLVLLPELGSAAYEIPAPAVALPLIMQFVTGFVLVWVYVGFRPRFGAGRRSIVSATLAVWLAQAAAFVVLASLVPVFAPLTIALVVVWLLIELTAAAFVGGGIYRRHAAAITRRKGKQIDPLPG